MKFIIAFVFLAAACLATCDYLSKQDGIQGHHTAFVTALLTGAAAAAALVTFVMHLLCRGNEPASKSTMTYPTVVLCLWDLDTAAEATEALIRLGIPDTHIFSCVDVATAREKLSSSLSQILIISANNQAEIRACPEKRRVFPIANRRHLFNSMENILAQFESLGFSRVIPLTSPRPKSVAAAA